MSTSHLQESEDYPQASASSMPQAYIQSGTTNPSAGTTNSTTTERGLSTASSLAQTIDEVRSTGYIEHIIQRRPDLQVCECSPTSKGGCSSADCSIRRLKEPASLHEPGFQTVSTCIEPEGTWANDGVQEIYIYPTTEAHKNPLCRPAVATLDGQCHLDLITWTVLHDRLGVSAINSEDTEEGLVCTNNTLLEICGSVTLQWYSRRLYKFHETKFYVPKDPENGELKFEVILSQKTIDRLNISGIRHCWTGHLPMPRQMDDASRKRMMACVEAQEQSAQLNAIRVREHAASRRAATQNFGRNANAVQSTRHCAAEDCSGQSCSSQH